MNRILYASSNDSEPTINLSLDYSQFTLLLNIRVDRKREKTTRELFSLKSYFDFSFCNGQYIILIYLIRIKPHKKTHFFQPQQNTNMPARH